MNKCIVINVADLWSVLSFFLRPLGGPRPQDPPGMGGAGAPQGAENNIILVFVVKVRVRKHTHADGRWSGPLPQTL